MPEVMEFKIDGKGRGVVPHAIRQSAGISPDVALVIYAEEPGRVVIESRDHVRARVWAAAPAAASGDAVATVRDERRADRARSDEALDRRSDHVTDDEAGQRLLSELGL